MVREKEYWECIEFFFGNMIVPVLYIGILQTVSPLLIKIFKNGLHYMKGYILYYNGTLYSI